MKETIFKAEIKNYRTEKMRDQSDFQSLYNSGSIFSKEHPFFQTDTTFTDEETFVKNFANPLCNVMVEYRMVVVEKMEEKVSIKIFSGYKSRRAGLVWFKQSKNCDFISVNLKTGNIYHGHIHNYNLKKKFTKRIFCNSYFINAFENFFISLKNSSNSNYDFYTRALEEFLNAIDNRNHFKLNHSQRLLKFHFDRKGIKYPNNFYLFKEYIFGKDYKKVLKKNENKLIDSVMELFKVKGNKLKKVLHQTTHRTNFNNYLFAKSLFGEDWLNQDDEIIFHLINSEKTIAVDNNYSDYFYQNATKKEKRNAFNLLKYTFSIYLIDIYTLSDHFRFWVELKRYGDTQTIWKSNGENENFFREEHLDWVDRLEHYKKGHYERTYPEIFNEVIKKFDYDNSEYFPKILLSSTDYNHESAIQSNCVKGYIGRCSSIIVSLRKGDENSEDRLTVEYSVNKLPEVKWVVIKRIQTRAKYNSHPSSEWNEPLNILDCLMNEIALSPKFSPHKLTKVCANGIQLNSESHFDESGYLTWSYVPIDQHGFQPYFI